MKIPAQITVLPLLSIMTNNCFVLMLTYFQISYLSDRVLSIMPEVRQPISILLLNKQIIDKWHAFNTHKTFISRPELRKTSNLSYSEKSSWKKIFMNSLNWRLNSIKQLTNRTHLHFQMIYSWENCLIRFSPNLN